MRSIVAAGVDITTASESERMIGRKVETREEFRGGEIRSEHNLMNADSIRHFISMNPFSFTVITAWADRRRVFLDSF